MSVSKIQEMVKGIGPDILRKALNSGDASGGALIHEHLEDVITDQIIDEYPEYAFISPQKIGSDSYKHKARDSRSGVGGATGESSLLVTKNSTYKQPDISLKIVARQFGVTDFMRDSSDENIDAFSQELEFEVRDQALSLNMYNLYGNAVADPYQYTGWDKSILTQRNKSNLDGWAAGAGTVPAALNVFDNMKDVSDKKGGRNHKRAYLMSSEMGSLLSRLYSTVRKNIPMETIRLPGGHELESYRNIPILNSTVISGSQSGTMGAITVASAGTLGGSLSDGTYYFRLSAITTDGETMASAESSVTLSGATSTQQISVTIDAPLDDAIAYKLFYSASTGLSTMSLIRWTPGKVYDVVGTATGNFNVITLLNVTADNTVAGIEADRPLTAVSGVNVESIYLIDFDEIQGMGRFAHNNSGQREDGIVTYEVLGKSKMQTEAFLATHGAIIPSYETSSVKASGWRVA